MDKTTKTIVGIIVVIIILGAVYALARSKQEKGEYSSNSTNTAVESTGPIKIGVVAPLTGDTANLGENERAALQIKQDEINAANGINGRQVELVFEDGQCDAKAATNAASKLINTDKVVAIVGGVCSGETLAIAPLAEQAHIPLISPSSTSPKITDSGDYVFRFIASDNFQGKFAANHFVTDLGKKKIAVLYCLADYCVGINDVFKTEITAAGGQLVADEGFQRNAPDLRTQLTKIKAANPDAIYFLGYTGDAILGLKQMKELGITAPVFAPDSWDDPKIATDTKGLNIDATFAVPGTQTLPQSFVDKMKAKVGDQMIYPSPHAYDALTLYADAVKKNNLYNTLGSIEAQQKIIQQLSGLSHYPGVSGDLTLDSQGNVRDKDFVLRVVKDGKFVEVK